MEKRFHCGHCGEKVSKTLYFQHKKLYYSSGTTSWCSTDSSMPSSSSKRTQEVEEFSFSECEDEADGQVHDDTLEMSDGPTGDSPLQLDYASESDDSDECSYEDDCFLEGDELTEVIPDEEESVGENDNRTPSQLVRAYVMFLLMWQALFRVSDTGLSILLLFISRLLWLVTAFRSFADQLPRNVTAAKKLIGIVGDNFTKYVSCPVCHTIYPLDSCKSNKSIQSRQCSFVRYPNHPHASRRRPCNTQLMKTVRTSSGTTTLCAKQLYCYRNLIDSLREFLKRPDFIKKCEAWRNRPKSEGLLTDIYDGQVWNDFMSPNGIPFLSVPFNFALSLNVDWFQPFKHSTYSLGAIYVAVLNLPREERYNNENVVLVGVIPGPREPKKQMNSYLRPLVAELNRLWNGVLMQCTSGAPVIVRAALICTACDIPAARKVSGFLGHSAYHACSRCLKTFPTKVFGDKADYSGYDRSLWPPRSKECHFQDAKRHKRAKTAKKQKEIERDSGCRYSVLLDLPYYDIVKFCVIDPMHNLLLGTAKHVLSVWKSAGIIEESHLFDIQRKVDAFITPTDIGRIPGKITSGFSSFTAEQWRNWTLIYSLCSLKDILPHSDYDCWLLFVKSTSLLCRRAITLQELDKADSLLMDFCDMFEKLYGKEHCTINMHLHGHLKECILDFGPVYSFWLFSFERLNGILGSYHTNCHDISVQIMRRFISNDHYSFHNWPTEYRDQFSSLIRKHSYKKGSLLSSSLEQCLANPELIHPLPPVYEVAWQKHQKQSISTLVAPVIGHNNYVLLTLYQKASALSVGGFILGSTRSRYNTTSHVMALHPKHPNQLHLAKIEHFVKLDIRDNSNATTICLWMACVQFFDEHQCKVWFGGPTQVWKRTTSPDMFYIPICDVKSRVAFCSISVNFGRVIGEEMVHVVSILSNFGN